MDCYFSKDDHVVLQLRRCVQTNFHNARAHTVAVIRQHLSAKNNPLLIRLPIDTLDL